LAELVKPSRIPQLDLLPADADLAGAEIELIDVEARERRLLNALEAAGETLADTDLIRRMDDFALDYIEQPLAWDDIHDHATLQQRIRTPLCLDECIRTVDHARKALQTDAARVINIKVGRSGGHVAARQIHDLSQAFQVPVWCGGMLESGIGRAHNIHLSTLPNFKKPGDTSSASRYFTRDIVQEKLETADGRMPVPKGAGTGVTLDHDYLARATLSHQELRP